MSWPTSSAPAPPTGPPRRSVAASSTYAAPPSGSATSPTTSPAASSRPAASDPNYTLDCDEPANSHLPGVLLFGASESSRNPIVPGQEDIRLSRPAQNTTLTGGSRLRRPRRG